MNLNKLFSNMSDMRTRYALRLMGRVLVLVVSLLLFIYDPGQFDALRGWNFFRSFSWLSLNTLWAKKPTIKPMHSFRTKVFGAEVT